MMGLFGKQHAVNDVFTPRRNEVNHEIYVDRSVLEGQLKNALRGSLHPIVYGESGSGKSWLYKKVLADINAEVFTANSANATPLRLGSITSEIRQIVALNEPKQITGYEEKMHATAKIPIAEGGLESTRKYSYAETDPVLDCFRLLRKKAGDKPAVLVIDNLEMIVDSEDRMQELASIITLLDDGRYAEFNVKLLIVGVPSEIRDYLSKTNSSVANRVNEIDEVSNLYQNQVDVLVEKGFVKLLSVQFPDGVLRKWQDHIFHVTMGYAQPVQEYCEQLGYIVEQAAWAATEEQLAKADEAWFKIGLSKAATSVATWMNERETKAGRRNQVLFALGKIEKRVFHANEIEEIVRLQFPQSTADVTLAIGQILSELTGGTDAIIKRSAKGNTYEFRDARNAMALRILLQKDAEKEKVSRIHQV